jgi:hypothetical protein
MAPTTRSKSVQDEHVDSESTATPQSPARPPVPPATSMPPSASTTDPVLLALLQSQQLQMQSLTAVLERLANAPALAAPTTPGTAPPPAAGHTPPAPMHATQAANQATSSRHATTDHRPHAPPFPPLLPTPQPHQDNPSRRPGKPDYPRFSGNGPNEWLFQLEKFFRYYDTPSEDKIAIAAMQLQDEANRWYQSYERERPAHSWEDFKAALVRRFGPTALEDANIAIKQLQQTSSVSAYQSAFENLQARIPSCPEPLLIGLYIGGLQRRILLQVQVWKPQSLQDAYALARHFEAALPDTTDRQRRRPPWFSQPSHNPPTEGLQQHPPSQNSASDSRPQQHHRQRLSSAELRQRIDKGLCWHCDEKYTPGHRCRARLYCLTGHEDSDDDFEDCFPDSDEPHEQGKLSLMSAQGITGPQQLRLSGHIKR